jgi:hypothetical protein
MIRFQYIAESIGTGEQLPVYLSELHFYIRQRPPCPRRTATAFPREIVLFSSLLVFLERCTLVT